MLAPLGVYARTSRRVSPHPVTLTQKHDALASHLLPLYLLPLTVTQTHPLTLSHTLSLTHRSMLLLRQREGGVTKAHVCV